MIYRHIVIIQDNQQIIEVGRRIIPTSKASPPVMAHPDHGDHMAISSFFKAEATDIPILARTRLGACPAIKRHTLTFRRMGIRNSFKLTERMENIPFPVVFYIRKLMPDIPDNTVIGVIIDHIMKGDCQLYRTKACT